MISGVLNSYKESLLKSSACIHIKGKIDKQGLIREYNSSDILLFVESFDEINIEKTKYSLSTKVPEYLSLHKPIFAVGPSEVASMQYLQDVAACAVDSNEIYNTLLKLLSSDEYCNRLSDKALQKYISQHDKKALQKKVVESIFEFR